MRIQDIEHRGHKERLNPLLRCLPFVYVPIKLNLVFSACTDQQRCSVADHGLFQENQGTSRLSNTIQNVPKKDLDRL